MFSVYVSTALFGLKLVDLNVLSIDDGPVHLLDGGLGRALVREGEEGVPLAGVVQG